MQKILVGLSGGVDSAVCAYLLKLAGYEVIGATLRTWVNECGEDSRCCEIDDAREIADFLGIPYYVKNCMAEFKEKVTEPFIFEYLNGRTPNPCVGCNRTVKWAKMLEMADALGADLVATGHYGTIVRKENGRLTVKQSPFAAKDQSYMLYRLTQEQLARTIMPLGPLTKEEVRSIAEKAGIPVAEKPDSQEICFIPDGDYAGYIDRTSTREVPPEGNFVDAEGRILGRHKGITHYTVGQRKGLGLAMGVPVFVKEIRPETNEVVIGSNEDLFSDTVFCRDLNFLSIPGLAPGETINAVVRIRYHHKGEEAQVRLVGDDLAEITFKRPVRAAAPGQAAVFYDEDGCVIGGGTIIFKSV